MEFAIAIDKSGHRLSTVLSQFGTVLFDEDGRRLDPAKAAAALTKLTDLVRPGAMPARLLARRPAAATPAPTSISWRSRCRSTCPATGRSGVRQQRHLRVGSGAQPVRRALRRLPRRQVHGRLLRQRQPRARRGVRRLDEPRPSSQRASRGRLLAADAQRPRSESASNTRTATTTWPSSSAEVGRRRRTPSPRRRPPFSAVGHRLSSRSQRVVAGQQDVPPPSRTFKPRRQGGRAGRPSEHRRRPRGDRAAETATSTRATQRDEWAPYLFLLPEHGRVRAVHDLAGDQRLQPQPLRQQQRPDVQLRRDRQLPRDPHVDAEFSSSRPRDTRRAHARASWSCSRVILDDPGPDAQRPAPGQRPVARGLLPAGR